MFLEEDALNKIINKLPEDYDFNPIEISFEKPVLMVFLRHFGCTFCRQALSDLSKIREQLDLLEVEVIFVHMENKAAAEKNLKKYKLEGRLHIGDPERILYSYFDLKRGKFKQLYGLNVMMKGLKAGLIDGHGHGGLKAVGDINQMPGLFMIKDGRIIRSYTYELSSDRPDYLEFIEFALLRYA